MTGLDDLVILGGHCSMGFAEVGRRLGAPSTGGVCSMLQKPFKQHASVSTATCNLLQYLEISI